MKTELPPVRRMRFWRLYAEDGRRFEPGAVNGIGVAGLAAGLDIIASVERETIQARVEMLARMLTRILIAHGWEVFSPGSGQPVQTRIRLGSAPAKRGPPTSCATPWQPSIL